MERYDYLSAIREDVINAISERYDTDEIREKLEDRDRFAEELNDDLWTADCVTGNGSGSYWFSRYRAEEAIMHNLDLLADAVNEFGGGMDVLKDGAEACDVTIRCYLLGQAVADVIDEFDEVLNG